MKLSKVDKKIIRFAYPLQIKPGFTKEKSLFHYLNVDEVEINASIKRLEMYKLLKVTDKKTSHDGVCYELTDLGVIAAADLSKSFFQSIKENPVTSISIGIAVYFFTYFMDLFSEEIKAAIICFFN